MNKAFYVELGRLQEVYCRYVLSFSLHYMPMMRYQNETKGSMYAKDVYKVVDGNSGMLH